ncbi:hypothetical protein L5515_004688 [Caenorhabditis briggsae]|uniref:Uncharacterized protein n=1 Tax=Caenorhabditis briggsae TaxID=6238 RepID=A0AAE9IQJ3_CAEBR|nr:hypothetical protein L3Y34_001846 [Caenorhabditis briggsae]UMM24468.1 hypothetical protein L5515_004688 [Caenorhabditis briggsae]
MIFNVESNEYCACSRYETRLADERSSGAMQNLRERRCLRLFKMDTLSRCLSRRLDHNYRAGESRRIFNVALEYNATPPGHFSANGNDEQEQTS